jgi:hypothetical protein
MYNAVEFERGGSDSGIVHIVPAYVVKVEYLAGSSEEGQTFLSRITLAAGEPEIVQGPPSEVNSRLRRGA